MSGQIYFQVAASYAYYFHLDLFQASVQTFNLLKEYQIIWGYFTKSLSIMTITEKMTNCNIEVTF